MQAMLLSTTYNSITTVLSNLHHSFTEVAQKTYHYVRSLSSAKQPTSALIISEYLMTSLRCMGRCSVCRMGPC